MIESFNGKTPRIAKSALIHRTACIIGDVEIGENSSIWPGVVIRGDLGRITLGKNVHVEDNSVLHPSIPAQEIGDNVIIGHGAVVEARKVGSNILMGNNCTILVEVEIGDYCIIGANAMLITGFKVPDRSLAVGVPAEVKGKLEENQLAKIQEKLLAYEALTRQYKQQASLSPL